MLIRRSPRLIDMAGNCEGSSLGEEGEVGAGSDEDDHVGHVEGANSLWPSDHHPLVLQDLNHFRLRPSGVHHGSFFNALVVVVDWLRPASHHGVDSVVLWVKVARQFGKYQLRVVGSLAEQVGHWESMSLGADDRVRG